jgi:hypothetical protein
MMPRMGNVQGLKTDDEGRLLVSGEIEVSENQSAVAAEGSGAVNAGVASGVLRAANADRVSIFMENISDTDVFLAYGEAAVLNQGIRLEANGGWHEETRYNGEIRCISSAAAKTVIFVEV